MRWIVVSVVLSVVFTVALNTGLRAFPGAGERVVRGLAERTSPDDDAPGSGRKIRVYAPWKAMVVGSVILTIVVNLLLRVL